MDFFPLFNSMRVASISTFITFFAGIFAAYYIAKTPRAVKGALDCILTLPLVLPPTVVGFFLLKTFGPLSPAGGFLLDVCGIKMTMTWYSAILASAIVAFPLMVQPIRLSFQLINQQLEQVAATLGAKPLRVFCSISLPLAIPGIIIVSILCFSRSLGEFGATITFVGNIPDETRTIPIAIYSFLQQPNGEEMAMRLVMLSLLLAFSALIANYVILQKYQKRLGG